MWPRVHPGERSWPYLRPVSTQTSRTPERRRPARALRDLAGRLASRRRWVRQHPHGLWWTFVALHAALFLALTPLMLSGGVSGDLPLYRTWATDALSSGSWPVLDFTWVYPAGALLPIVLPNVLGESMYQFVWLVMLTLLNGVSLWVLTDRGRRTVETPAAWWWLLVLFLLSPVAFLRLEGFSAPMVLMALVLLARRPRVAGLLLAGATWIKVWPAAVIAAVMVASRRRSTVVRSALLVTAGVAAAVALGGGLSRIDTFISTQSSRGLQLEAPLSTPWVWMAMLRVPGASVYQNVALATREVMGPGDTWAINGSTELMLGVVLALLALLAVAAFGLPGARRSTSGDEVQLVLLGALTLTTTFVVFNKVGSPQYMLWIAPVVAVGLAQRPDLFRVPARLTAWAAGLTTLVFPVMYRELIDLQPAAVLALAARNAIVVALLGWCVVRLMEAALAAAGLPGWTLRRALGLLPPDRGVAAGVATEARVLDHER